MNDNTILRIKVPAHLYESVKKQLTLTEAKKQNYGAGFSVVKEKKVKVPKDGMEKVQEIDYVPGSNPDIDDKTASDTLSGMTKETKDKEMEKKTRSLEELKKAKTALDKKIQQMEGVNENVEEGALNENDLVNWIISHGQEAVNAIKTIDPETLGYLATVAGITGAGAKIGTDLSKKEKETGKSAAPISNRMTGANREGVEKSVNELFGFGGSKFKDGDKVYIKVNGEFEKTPRKINLRSGKPFKQDGKTMYFLTQPEDERGQFWTSGGTSASEDNIQLAK